MDGFAMLEQDHRAVERLFDEYEQSEDDATAGQIRAGLRKHADVEEQVLYPMLREFGDKTSQLSDNTEEAHDTIEQTIGRVEIAAPDAVPELMRTLREQVETHVREEETDVFPTMRDLGVDPDRLGDALEVAGGVAT
jgi:hemerythrin superfamily protein